MISNSNHPSGRVIIAGLISVIGIAIAAFVIVASFDNKDLALFVGLVGTLILPTVTALLAAIKADQVGEQAQQNSQQINSITAKMNGTMESVHSMLENQQQQAATLHIEEKPPQQGI